LAEAAARGSNLQFLLARVEQARAEAEAATLDHVRQRCRRSEAAWSELAERAERSQQIKAAESQRKAEITAEMNNEDTIEDQGPDGPRDPRERGRISHNA